MRHPPQLRRSDTPTHGVDAPPVTTTSEAYLPEVADLTSRVMCDTVQEFFPQLQPKAEVNISQPSCWNKDGHADALERWLEDPTYSF